MKILKSILVCIGVCLVTHTIAQEANTVLWKVSGNGLESPSYLFGTIHLICPEDFNLSDHAKDALNQSEQLMLELDMDDPEFVAKTQQLSINPRMKNISEELSEKDLALLNTFYEENYGVGLSQFGIMKPFTLLSLMLIKGLDCPQPASYEQELMAFAKSKEWEIKGLETLEDQFAIFDEVPQEEQIQWLLDYANSMEDFKADMNKMVKVYKSQDISAMLELMSDYPEYKQIEDELLYHRNKKWIATITENAKEKPTFFAFGAAHLASDKGVIHLLEKEGYTVAPVL